MEEKKSDFKITMLKSFENFSNKVEERKSDIKFLGQTVFPELHSYLTSSSQRESFSPNKE